MLLWGMSLNNKEISLILDELKLEGYYLQKITQPTHFSLILHLYKQSALQLYINLASGETRLHAMNIKMPKEEKLMRFLQLLRSKIIGGKIEEAKQINENRIVLIKFVKGVEKYHFYVKLWSNAANILLANEDDIIIDVFYRRKAKGEVAKEKFILPEKKEEAKQFTIRSHDNSITFNEAIEKEYSNTSKTLSRSALLEDAQNVFNKKIEKIEKVIKKLKQKEKSFKNAKEAKHIGDILISNIYKIKKASSLVNLYDYETNKEIQIALDPLKSPQENAQSYYTQYKKALSGIEKVKEDIFKYQKEIENLKASYSLLSKETNSVIISRLLEKEKQKEITSKSNDKQIGLKFIVSGWTILVGRSNKENDLLLRHEAKGNDTWLHTRDVPGGFVFIKSQGIKKSIPQNVLIVAGNLAVFYSKARKMKEADLYKTNVKYLRRAKDGPLGTVLPHHEKNIFIKLDSSIIENLKPL